MTKRLLLLDDEPNIIRALVRVLSRLRLDIDTSHDPFAALQLLQENNYDLIISDQRMPGMLGTDFLAQASNIQPSASRMILSGYSDFTAITQAFNEGKVCHFMSKPWDVAELCEVVSKLMDHADAPSSTDWPTMEGGLLEFHGILTQSNKMIELFGRLKKAALANVPVFIYGETGTGKELVANALHAESGRHGEKFVAYNCANFSDTLMESQLFGHKKGAFTGAVADAKGLLFEAQSGTLFLDETTTLPLPLQAKLLRVLQERSYSPVGSYESIPFGAQVIAASSTRLSDAVANGDFREDLRFRFEVIPVDIPPLRERDGDCVYLFKRFLMEVKPDVDWQLSAAAENVIATYHWPGNVRQCQNAAHYAAAMAEGSTIEVAALPDYCQERLTPSQVAATPLPDIAVVKEDIDREQVIATLKQYNYKKGAAAKALGISRMTLWRRLKEWGIEAGPAGD